MGARARHRAPAQPEDETCAVRWLCFAVLLRESNPPARAAAGGRHSVFIDGEGRLSSCGTAVEDEEVEEEDLPSLLGHGEGVLQVKTPTRLASLGGERAISVWRRHDTSASLSPRMAPFGPGAVAGWAIWDTATCSTSGSPRRSKPWRASA